MAKRNLSPSELSNKLAKQERQCKKELAKTYLEYLETLSFKKRVQEMVSILYETEVKRVVTLDHRLTPQEKKCIFLSSMGKGIKEIATILKFRPRTAKFHRDNAIKKLNAKTITGAITLGIKYNYFLLPQHK